MTQQVKMWHGNAYYCNDDRLIRWYEGHLKWKAKKAQSKKELIPITWHPSRWWDWCIPYDEKRDTAALWA